MKILILVGIVVALAIVVALVLKKRGASSAGTGTWPYYAKKPLTQPEQILYHLLVKALPDHIVLAQVQVSRVLGVKQGFNRQEWINRINQLSYDFVICGKDSTVLAVIELDDKSHDAAGRKATDVKKDKATTDAGLRLLRWHVKSLPDLATIRATLTSPSAATPMNPARATSTPP